MYFLSRVVESNYFYKTQDRRTSPKLSNTCPRRDSGDSRKKWLDVKRGGGERVNDILEHGQSPSKTVDRHTRATLWNSLENFPIDRVPNSSCGVPSCESNGLIAFNASTSGNCRRFFVPSENSVLSFFPPLLPLVRFLSPVGTRTLGGSQLGNSFRKFNV